MASLSFDWLVFICTLALSNNEMGDHLFASYQQCLLFEGILSKEKRWLRSVNSKDVSDFVTNKTEGRLWILSEKTRRTQLTSKMAVVVDDWTKFKRNILFILKASKSVVPLGNNVTWQHNAFAPANAVMLLSQILVCMYPLTPLKITSTRPLWCIYRNSQTINTANTSFQEMTTVGLSEGVLEKPKNEYVTITKK